MILELILDIAGLYLATYLIVKLLASQIYLKAHRLLPVILAEVVIYNFFEVMEILPLSGDPKTFSMLSDITAMTMLFLLYLYAIFLRDRSNNVYPVIAYFLALVVLVGSTLLFYDDLVLRRRAAFGLIIINILPVLVSTNIEGRRIARSHESKKEKMRSYHMLITFPLIFAAFAIQEVIFPTQDWIYTLGMLIVCAIYGGEIKAGRIEDPSTVLKNAVFEKLDHPMALLSQDFYMMEFNDASSQVFKNNKVVIENFFEDGDLTKRAVGGIRILETGKPEIFEDNNRWYRLSVNPVDNADSTVGYIAYITDITEEKAAEEQAKTEVKAKSQFLAMMSHELRSPLHAVIGISDILLAKREISSRNRGLVGHIKSSATGLLDLVDAILDVSKIDAGKFEFAESQYNIEKMLRDLCYNNIVNLQSKPVDFEIRMLSDYPVNLYGDQMRVREIFQNIMGNAVKFTNEGSVITEIRCEIEEGNVAHFFFKVSDTGNGMTPEQLRSLFEDYVSYAGGVKMEGTGLGMSITKKLVEKLGGNLVATSDGATGSQFTGDFYQKIDGYELRKAGVIDRASVSYEVANFNSAQKVNWACPTFKILVADDMKINREILGQLLVPWKCKVVGVENGQEAVQRVKESHFDMIMLDQMMPVLSGYEAAKLISEITDAPIILVTANTDDGVREEYKNYGFTDMLPKPMQEGQLAALMDTYVPKDRRESVTDTSVYMTGQDITGLKGYKRTLKTFVKEIAPLYENLKIYAITDHERFWIKTHGIKGVARQIGREDFADLAEVMEMAAKSEHWGYINRHISEFLEDMADVMEDVNKEISTLNIADEDEMLGEVLSDIETGEDSLVSFNEELKELRKAFDEYDIRAIEKKLEQLNSIATIPSEKDLVAHLSDLCEELEYDEGVNIIDEYVREKND